MNRDTSNNSIWRSAIIVILAACLLSLLGMGVRSSFGLFLEPMTLSRGWNRETFAFAMALQNLLWGIGVPIASAISDRFGPAKVIAAGALLYSLGTIGMAMAESSLVLHLSGGIIAGIGVAFSSFSIALSAIAGVVSPERRSLALGLGTASGSLGQVIFSPIALIFISSWGWHPALLVLGLISIVILPLAFFLPAPVTGSDTVVEKVEQSLREALEEAAAHRGYVLLALGFFVCGFHVAFVMVHMPAYIKDLGLPARVGAYSLSIIGFCNIIGSFLSGWVGQRWSKKRSLSAIYLTRAIIISIMLMMPKTELTIYLFSFAIGILWLSTVPLTMGIVAQVFGVRYMATLVGIVFFSHQVGSFIGVWLGGYLYDNFGTYDPVWYAAIVLGVLAALLHIPIDERPLPRLAPSPQG